MHFMMNICEIMSSTPCFSFPRQISHVRTNSDFVVFALPEIFSCFSFCKDLKVLLELDEWAVAERDDGSGEGPLHSLDPAAIKSFSMPLQGIAKQLTEILTLLSKR